MRVRFWEPGGRSPPRAGTNHFGGNTSCVELTTASGDLLILDCGTGAHRLAAALMARAGQPSKRTSSSDIHTGITSKVSVLRPGLRQRELRRDLRPRRSGGSLHEVLAGQMEFTYFPVDLNQLPAAITYHDLTEGIRTIGGAQVATQYLNHPAMTVGYRVEADGVAVVYLVDHEPFSPELWRAGAEPGSIESILHEGDRRHAKFMAGADLVIHDAQYTPEEYGAKKTWGHSAYDYVVQIAAAAGVRLVALTHHDPSHDDHFVAEIERKARARPSNADGTRCLLRV